MVQEEIEVLKDWLETQDYWEGVKLYEGYGSSEFLKDLLRSSEDDINAKYLLEGIKSIVSQYEYTTEQAIKQYPKELQDKVEVAKRLMDERASLKTVLRMLYQENAPEKRLKETAFKILAINDELKAIYDEERFYKRLGHLPESTDYAQENGEYLLKRLLNLRTYVSKYKDRPDKLQQYQAELFEVEKKLEQLGLLRIDDEQKKN